MAAKGTKKTKSTKGVTPINPPWWGTWGGNRANVPVPGPGFWDFNTPLGYNPNGSPVTAPGIAPDIAPTATPTSAAPNVPPYQPYDTGNVNIGDPAWYLRTGSPNIPGGSQVPDDYVPLWNPWQDPVFQWENDMSGLSGEFREGIDPTDFDYYDQNFVWDEDVYGKKEDWTSSYHPLYYQNKSAEPLQWLAGSSNGGNMGSRGWRRPGRYYIPDQQVTRAGPNGPITAERPKPPPRRGETPNPEGNNKNLTIPAWVGSLVSWRT